MKKLLLLFILMLIFSSSGCYSVSAATVTTSTISTVKPTTTTSHIQIRTVPQPTSTSPNKTLLGEDYKWIIALIFIIASYIANILFCGWLASQKNRSPLTWSILALFFGLTASIAIAGALKVESPSKGD